MIVKHSTNVEVWGLDLFVEYEEDEQGRADHLCRVWVTEDIDILPILSESNLDAVFEALDMDRLA